MLDLVGRPVLVVGGGTVAARKVRGLLDAGADVQVVAPEVDAQIDEAVAGGRATWTARGFVPGDVRDAPTPWALVVAATDDPDVNAEVVTEAAACGVWVNDVSSPGGGPAALPAVYRDGPLTVAVSTGGASPATAAWLRDEVAASLGPEHRTLVELVADARDQARCAGLGGGQADWRSVLDSGMLDLIRLGRITEAKERLQACLSSSSD
jgi:siroheme synthase-like protein